jgi:hypothetical protein
MTAPLPHCRDCGGRVEYDADTGRLCCGDVQCVALGIEVPVWRALKDAGLAADVVVGLPRPIRDGLPVPWVVPCSPGTVWWKLTDAERLCDAQNLWLCQLCGETLPAEAWVLVTPEGMVLQAALHEECKDLALEFCRHLSSSRTRAVPLLVTRGQLTTDGRPLTDAPPSDPYFLHQWELDPAVFRGRVQA